MMTKHKFTSFLTIIALGLFFVGCSKLKQLAPDITLHPSFPVDIQIAIPPATSIMSTNNSYTFNDSVTIDPTTDTLVAKYESYIKSWEVDSVTAIFTDVSTPVNLTNVSLQVKTGTETFGWQASSISVDNGTNLVLDNSQGQLDKLGQVLNGKQSFKVVLSGISDQDNVHFTLSVKINTTLVANPLGSV
jgi:PBP1b-binding outer membrane lipoprotein LpoB